ncbi:P-loop containing nucleoside triphosphate hydrolase protein [Cyathus striatus]|nr:P-loop containing nucleoside triphosphate hydrolase protein [Cyathus striatus]
MLAISAKKNKKRKLQNNASASKKKAKILHQAATTEELPWKKVVRPIEAGLGGDDGILEFEEVEGVEVVYEETNGGRVAKFNVLSKELERDGQQALTEEQIARRQNSPDAEVSPNDEELAIVEELPPFDSKSLLPEWHSYSLHPQLLRFLHSKAYNKPTPIQSASLPVALAGRDVVGVAQTGSGKTLAYGLPILHYLLSQPRPSSKKQRPLRALILCPTRELALQVSSHLNACLNSIDAPESIPDVRPTEKMNKGRVAEKPQPPQKKTPPHVSVSAIVGGMSAQKQRRILDRGVDVLIATPGRLWDIMEDDDTLAREIKNLKFLVLDEADRMIEAGHFAELENILRLTLRESKSDQIPTEFDAAADATMNLDDEDTKEGIKDGLQTFVCSATLSKDLQRNLKKRFKPNGGKKHYKKDQAPSSTLDDLLLRLDFRDPNPEVIDLSPTGGAVSTLQESKIECLSADKDVYLYYFLLRYPGRSLVFLSSIDGIRRLMPLVELLNIKAFPLHSQLEQRQRLKNLDRFKNTENSVLLATDIAARGLDIPAVDHVVHFQIPRTADTYIHRNGRTARAMQKGFSMLMCGPEERRVVRALLGSLGRDEADIPEMSIELSLLDKLKERVQLARKIETSLHKIKKKNHDKNWMKETAEVLGVELDSDIVSDSDNEKKSSRKTQAAKTGEMKAQLKAMLAQPLIVRGVSTRYITSGSRSIVDNLLAGELNQSMVGVKNVDAGTEVISKKKKKQPQTVKKEKKLKEEEKTSGSGEES